MFVYAVLFWAKKGSEIILWYQSYQRIRQPAKFSVTPCISFKYLKPIKCNYHRKVSSIFLEKKYPLYRSIIYNLFEDFWNSIRILFVQRSLKISRFFDRDRWISQSRSSCDLLTKWRWPITHALGSDNKRLLV